MSYGYVKAISRVASNELFIKGPYSREEIQREKQRLRDDSDKQHLLLSDLLVRPLTVEEQDVCRRIEAAVKLMNDKPSRLPLVLRRDSADRNTSGFIVSNWFVVHLGDPKTGGNGRCVFYPDATAIVLDGWSIE